MSYDAESLDLIDVRTDSLVSAESEDFTSVVLSDWPVSLRAIHTKRIAWEWVAAICPSCRVWLTRL